MATLFDSASLALIPSGYKEDKVYSIKPTDGSGDLAFSRSNDTATRVNSSGIIEKVRTNIILHSNGFDNAAWSKSAAGTGLAPVVTANAGTAPDGTNTAFRVQFDAVGGGSGDRSRLRQNITSVIGVTYNYSIFIKAFSAGEVGKKVMFYAEGATSSTDIVLTNDYQRVSLSGPATLTTVIYTIETRGTLSNTTADVLMAFTQAETGDIATDYIATTSAAVSVGPVANLPRLDYSGGASCPKLLLEGQRTNSHIYSEQLNNAAWTTLDNVSVSANVSTTLDPSGYYGADKLVENTANDQHRIYRSAGGTGSTFSFFAKAAERSWVSVLSNNGDFSFFDIANGTLGTIQAGSTATITPYGNGWYRCTLYNTHFSNGSLIQLATANNVTSYLGDGTSGAFIWGCQFESSATYATSYIPTLSAASTRGADGAGTSDVFGTTFTLDADFSLYWEGVINGTLVYPTFFSGGNYSSGSDYRSYLVYNGNTFQLFGVNEVLTAQQAIALTLGVYTKILVKRVGSTIKWYVNGTEYANQSGFTTTTVKIRSLFGSSLGAPNHESVAQALIFETALTDSEAIALTTI